MLQDRRIEDPYLLIVIEHNGNEMDRYIVPLTAEMRYVQFRRPGTNNIHATIVWAGPFTEKSVKHVFTRRSDHGSYVTDALVFHQPGVAELEARVSSLWDEFYESGDEGDDEAQASIRAQADQIQTELREARATGSGEWKIREFDSVSQLGAEAQLSVVVPEAMFAKDPPRWMTWLGNRFPWERAPRDQCVLRRRALFTGAALPFYMAGKVLVTVLAEVVHLICTIVLLVWGARELNFEPLRNPTGSMPEAIWRHAKPSIWWTKKRVGKYETEYPDRHPVFVVVNPPVVMFFVLVGGVLNLIFGSMLFLIIGVAAAFALGLLILVIMLLGAILGGPFAYIGAKWGKMRESNRQAQVAVRKQQQEQRKHALELLACDNRSHEVSLSALPKQRRTVVLRYHDLKSRVCRPFAR